MDQLHPEMEQDLPEDQEKEPAQDPTQGNQLIRAAQGQAHSPGRRQQNIPALSGPAQHPIQGNQLEARRGQITPVYK